MKDITELLTIEETAFRIGITRRTLDKWWRDGRFPHPIKVGRRHYYHPDMVSAYLNERVEQWFQDQAATAD